MITILHGSDLHFGKPHFPPAAEAFLGVVGEVDPDILVLSGDFTQRAKVREYEEARAWLDRLPDELPVVVTPGNHDVPLYRVFERLFTPYRNYRQYLSDDLDTVTRIPGLTVVALNSAAPRRAITNGRIRDRQVAFAREAFASAPEADARVLVTHHPLSPAPDYERDHPLPNAPNLLEAFTTMGVEAILGGHLHRAYIGNSLDIHPGPTLDRSVVLIQSGTTTSRRGRAREEGRNSYNVVRIGEERLEVVHHMFFEDATDDADGGFAPFSAHVFPRAPAHTFGTDPLMQERLPARESGAG